MSMDRSFIYASALMVLLLLLSEVEGDGDKVKGKCRVKDKCKDINEGSETSKCQTSYEAKPKGKAGHQVTFRAEENTKPIIGIFATRDNLESPIWGTGNLKKLSLAKKNCYDSARAYYSVVAATAQKEPLTIDFTFTTTAKEICSYGYNVKVCYKE